LPVLLAIDYRNARLGRREWARLGAGLALGTTLGLGFLVAVPAAIEQIYGYHAARGLHVESTFGIALGAIAALRGAALPTHYDYGSINFQTPASFFLAKCTVPLTVIVATALVVLVIRRTAPADDERARSRRVVASAYAVIVVLWLTSKVFSPQYLTWGIPLAIALWGRGRRQVVGLTAAAMVVSQVYLRFFYGEVVAQTGLALVLLVARQTLLVALLAVLVRMACARRGALFHSLRA
jgi:hypothetical protein